MGPPPPFSSSYPRAHDSRSRSSSSHRNDNDAAEDWVKPPLPGASSSKPNDKSASGSWSTTGATSGWTSPKADGASTNTWGASNTTGGWGSSGNGWGSSDPGEWGNASTSAPAWGSTWGADNSNAMDTDPIPGPSGTSDASRPKSSSKPQESTMSTSNDTWGSSSTPARDAWGPAAIDETSEPMQVDEAPAISYADKGKGKEIQRDRPLVDQPSLPHRRSSSGALPMESPDPSRVREMSIVSNRSHASDKSGSHVSSIPTDPQEIHHRAVKQVNSHMHTKPY